MSNALESTRTSTTTTPTVEPDPGACPVDLPSDPLDMIGHVLEGRYRVEACVGEGGYSHVYRAHHLAFEQPVALKFLKLEGSFEQRAAKLQAFQHEGRLLFRACSLHPAVVQLKDLGFAMRAHQPVPYLVLEWVGGQSLSSEIRGRSAADATRTIEQAVETFAGIADGLATLHRSGIAHRDVKPGNLIYSHVHAIEHGCNVTSAAERPSPSPAQSGVRCTPGSPIDCDGRRSSTTEALPSASLRLTDFGIAKLVPIELESGRMMTTSTGAGQMTPMFAAPEQWWRQLGSTGPWTDVYSFALTMLHWMAGPQPLPPTHIAFLAAGETHRYPNLGTLGLALPKPVEEVFAKALAGRIEDRFANVGAFWRALLASTGASRADRDSPKTGLWARPAWLRSGLFGVIGLVVGSMGVLVTGAFGQAPTAGELPPGRAAAGTSCRPMQSEPRVESSQANRSKPQSVPASAPDALPTSSNLPVASVAVASPEARRGRILPSPRVARPPNPSAKPEQSAPIKSDDEILRLRVEDP